MTLAALALILFAQDPKDTDDLLDDLKSAIDSAIKKAPKDADTRGKLIAASKSVFDAEVAKSVPKNPKMIWDWQTHFVELLTQADKKWSGAEVKNERQIWIAACKAALARMILAVKDQPVPDTEDLYTTLYGYIGKAKGAFTGDNSLDLRTAAFNGAKDIFSKVLSTAKPSSRDAQRVYEAQLARIDKEYPQQTEKDKKWNKEPVDLLKAAAKSAFEPADRHDRVPRRPGSHRRSTRGEGPARHGGPAGRSAFDQAIKK